MSDKDAQDAEEMGVRRKTRESEPTQSAHARSASA